MPYYFGALYSGALLSMVPYILGALFSWCPLCYSTLSCMVPYFPVPYILVPYLLVPYLMVPYLLVPYLPVPYIPSTEILIVENLENVSKLCTLSF